MTDVDGRRYLDMLAAYSAINFGHRHPRLVAAAQRQLERVTLVSRAFEHDQFGPFCAELAELAGMEMVLPMNTGAEAVETAIKAARKWGYEVKGVPARRGGHRGLRRATSTAGPPRSCSFSTDPDARDRLRPLHAGVPGRALRRPDGAVPPCHRRAPVVAVLVEPIQGEAGRARPAAGLPARGARAVHASRARC